MRGDNAQGRSAVWIVALMGGAVTVAFASLFGVPQRHLLECANQDYCPARDLYLRRSLRSAARIYFGYSCCGASSAADAKV